MLISGSHYQSNMKIPQKRDRGSSDEAAFGLGLLQLQQRDQQTSWWPMRSSHTCSTILDEHPLGNSGPYLLAEAPEIAKRKMRHSANSALRRPCIAPGLYFDWLCLSWRSEAGERFGHVLMNERLDWIGSAASLSFMPPGMHCVQNFAKSCVQYSLMHPASSPP